MYFKKLFNILYCMIIFFAVLGTAFAVDQQYKSEASGSFTSSVIDSNGDGIPGVTGNLEGQSTFGSLTIYFFSEFDLAAAEPSENCPDGYLELPLVNSNTIHRHRNGDLLFFETTAETFCGHPEGQFIWEEILTVIGGTGKFSNASGSLESTGTGVILLSDEAGLTSFGGVSLSNKGKIMLNKK